MERSIILGGILSAAVAIVACTPPVYLNKERAKMYANPNPDWEKQLSEEVQREHLWLKTSEFPQMESELQNLKRLKDDFEKLGNPLFGEDNPFGEWAR